MNQSTINKALERAKVAYKVKNSFVGRNYFLFWGFVAVGILAALWSMATAGGNLYIRFAGMFGEGTPALLAAAVGAFTLIGLQYFSGKGTVDDLQIGILKRSTEGEWKYSAGDRAFFFLKAVGFICATAASITLSISGVKAGNEWFRYDKRPPTEQVADVSFFDSEVARLSGNIETEKGRKWKGVLVTDASRRIERYEKELSNIRAQRAAAIAGVQEKNSLMWSKWERQTERNSTTLQGVGGIAEIVVVFCIIFIGLYDDGLYREAGVKRGATVAPSFPEGIGFSRQAPAFGERNEGATMSAIPPPVVVTGFRSPVAVNNAGNIAFSVAPAQQKAQQTCATVRNEKPQRKRNESAEIAQLKKEKASAQSAIRNARTAQRKAQREFEMGAMEEPELSATLARLQATIQRNEKRVAQLEKRLK